MQWNNVLISSAKSTLQIDGVGNVLDEAPIKLANCVLLFCKGLGWLTSVNLPGIETRRQSQDGQVGAPDRACVFTFEGSN